MKEQFSSQMNANEREEELKILPDAELLERHAPGKAINVAASFSSLLYLRLFAFIRGPVAFAS